MSVQVDLCGMAEVRLQFGQRAYKLSKRQRLPILDKNEKFVCKAACLVPLLNSPQLCDLLNEISGADTRWSEAEPAGSDTLHEETKSYIFSKGLEIIRTNNRSFKPPIHVCYRRGLSLGKPCCSAGARCQFRRSLYEHQKDHFRHFVTSTKTFNGTHNNENHDEPLFKSKSAYYDLLEVPSSATHAQIKTAYYKQSFIYHPDKNAGSEDATFRFSQISEAYSVVGNKELRRKYDRGILSEGDLRGSGKARSPAGGHHTRVRHSPSVKSTQQQKVFDFDAFIRAHYGEQLHKERQRRQSAKEARENAEKMSEEIQKDSMAETIVGVIFILGAVFLFSSRK